MKRYRLKKDLPTYKAGDVFVLNCHGLVLTVYGEEEEIAYAECQLKKFPNILTDWFEEIKEPLIETADARYIVKLWASTNLIPRDAKSIEYQLADTLKGTLSEFWCDSLHIVFWGRVAPSAIHGKCYTIDELCGEEKE